MIADVRLLVPKKRPDYLTRRRLVDFLDEHISRKLIVLSAAAGYGKTSLLIDWARETEIPVCWYSVSSLDRDERAFLANLTAAIAKVFPEFGKRTMAVLTSGTPKLELEAEVDILVGEIWNSIPDFFAVVIDDLHIVDRNGRIVEALNYLLSFLPENCHMLISTRNLPRLKLGKLLAEGQAVGLGNEELMFTVEEVQLLLEQGRGRSVDKGDAQELVERFEGWITGILLSTQDNWRKLNKSVGGRRGMGSVFAFLADEIFDLQDEAMQRFLLETAVLREMDTELCNSLLDISNAGDTLASLESRNVFVTRLEGEGEWYRYHQLFQEFLLDRLERSDSVRLQSLRLQAARLFVARVEIEEAMPLFLKAGAYAEAAEVILTVSPVMMQKGRWVTVAGWVDALPESFLKIDPDLCLLMGKVCVQLGELDRAEELVDQAGRIFAAQNRRSAMAETWVELGTISFCRGQYQKAEEDCQRALGLADPHEYPAITARAYRGAGMARYMLGELEVAGEKLSSALELFERTGDSLGIANTLHDIGANCWRNGEWSKSEQSLYRALSCWERNEDRWGAVKTLTGLGVVKHYQGERENALTIFDKARAMVVETGDHRHHAYILASIGDIYRDLAEADAALGVYDEAMGLSLRIGEEFLLGYINAVKSTVLLTLGRNEDAEYHATLALESGRRHDSRYEVALFQLALGNVCLAKHELKRSQEYFSSALKLLQGTTAKMDLAKGHLCLGHSLFLSGDLRGALGEFDGLLSVVREIGVAGFLGSELRTARVFLEYAGRVCAGNETYSLLARQVALLDKSIERRTVPMSTKETAAEAVKPLAVYAFGQPEVVRNGVPVSDWRSAAERQLLLALLAHPKGIPKDSLLEMIWPHLPPAKSAVNLYTTIYRLRRALDQPAVHHAKGVYSLSLSCWYDVAEFEGLLTAAQVVGIDAEHAAGLYRRAVDLYRGDYLDGSDSDWCDERREALSQQYVKALVFLARYHARLREYEKSIPYWEKLLKKDSYREDAYRGLMRCHAAMGDRGTASKYYQLCQQTLSAELGIQPSAKTKVLYRQIAGTSA